MKQNQKNLIHKQLDLISFEKKVSHSEGKKGKYSKTIKQRNQNQPFSKR